MFPPLVEPCIPSMKKAKVGLKLSWQIPVLMLMRLIDHQGVPAFPYSLGLMLNVWSCCSVDGGMGFGV